LELLKATTIMIKGKRILIFCLPVICGCHVLTDSQIKNINTFATATKRYASFPGEVLKKRAELHLNTELLEVSQFSTSSDLIEKRINSARENYKAVMKMSYKFDLSLKLIQQYAGLLSKLSEDSYVENFTRSTEELGENLTGLLKTYNNGVAAKLPENIGSQISKVVLLAGRRLTKSRQAKELKRFIPLGDVLIKTTTNNLIEVLDSDAFAGSDGVTYPSLKSLLQQEQESFVKSYKNVVFSNSERITYSSVQAYDEALTGFENAELLRQKSVSAAKKLAKAHDRLTRNIQSKKKMKEIIEETQDLISDVQQLNKLATTAYKVMSAKL
jgi:hypothetical protein